MGTTKNIISQICSRLQIFNVHTDKLDLVISVCHVYRGEELVIFSPALN